MLFKLSLKNIKKSFKDYTIYFITLALGVAIFYIFNSLDSQRAMIEVSKSTEKLIELMINMLAWVSVFVSFILGFLIVYANNFLIKRRKKEFGIYMTLGMGRRKISKILIIETLMIGVMSLGVGLIMGIFGSQFMSILVGKLFAADMSKFEFVFSSAACIKTCVYFGIMYLLVMLFNTFTISRYKLIDLLTAVKKTEKIKLKNTVISVILFIISIVMLGYAYYNVSARIHNLNQEKILIMIGIGTFATFLFFFSLSGFILKLVQSCKKIYFKELNMFVLRQTNAKINTTVVSMSIICLLLFLTICILSSALAVNLVIQTGIRELAPVDIGISKTLDLSGNDAYGNPYSEKRIEDSKISIIDTLKKVDFDFNDLVDLVDITIYATNELTVEDTFGDQLENVKSQFQMLKLDTAEDIIKVSDYNKVARLYGIQEYSLQDDEYIILCDYKNMKIVRDMALKENTNIKLLGKTYHPKYNECQDGFIYMSANHINTGIILVPDSCNLTEDVRAVNYIAANYHATTKEERKAIEEKFLSDDFLNKLKELDSDLSAESKISIFEASTGLSAMVTFIGIYLGMIFLISSAAILALKELSESSDNKERYNILRRIGADEKMINKALFRQIGIFFITPLLLAIIHSIFGIYFATNILDSLFSGSDLTTSIIMTATFIIFIYGGYFVATYFGSKNIIKECNH
ncbi:MAG: ABC transporter permease [Clostridia bacterium]|nr:ABC transporter permease [Clostridia bacterium]